MVNNNSLDLKKNKKGTALVEYALIIAMILLFFSFIYIFSFSDSIKANICKFNCSQIETPYKVYLNNNGLDHSDILFNEFLKKHRINRDAHLIVNLCI